MPYDVVVGPFNPLALPVVLDFEPPKALGRAAFDVAYEGAPGCVHGAVLAATFDIVLTAGQRDRRRHRADGAPGAALPAPDADG